jgi:HEAT repeat protein
MGELPEQLPALAKADIPSFLKLWVHLHAAMRGGASAGLNEVARRLQSAAHARALLARGRRADELLAILALGYLRDRDAWAALERVMAGPDAVVSVHAAWALTRIDADAAAARLIEQVATRADWPLPQVVAILEDGGPAYRASLLAALPALQGQALLRALRIAEGLGVRVPAPLAAQLLSHAEVDVVVAVLRLEQGPEQLPAIRALVGHPDWRVRVQVAKSVGRLGAAGDTDLLLRLAADPEWWVRYRAARALAETPGRDRASLAALADQATDSYAADMLRHVLAETEAA